MLSKYEQRQSALTAYTNHIVSKHPTPIRFHKDVELIYVAQGHLEIMIDSQTYRLEAGCACVVFPNILHNITEQSCHKHLIMVSPALIPEFRNLLSQHKPLLPVLQPEQAPDLLPMLFQRCVRLYATQANHPLLLNYIQDILMELLEQIQLEPRSAEPELILQIMDFILEHYAEDISLEQLAQTVGYSKFHISRCLNDTFGCNFRTLVNNYRIDMAEKMLLQPGCRVTDVAYTCGFQTQTSFNRSFRKHCSMTPSQFQRENNHSLY